MNKKIEDWQLTSILINFLNRHRSTLNYSIDQLIEDLQSYPDKEALSELSLLMEEARKEELKGLLKYVDDYPGYKPIGTTRQFCKKMLEQRLSELEERK